MHILQLQALVCLTTMDAKNLLGNGVMVFVIGLRICIRHAIAPHAACMECTFSHKVSCIISLTSISGYFDLYVFPSFWKVSEKTGYMTFRNVLWMTSAVYLFSFILQLIFGSGLVSYLPLFFALFFSIFFRLYVVRRENIRTNGEFLECCIAFWCLPCSTAQSKQFNFDYLRDIFYWHVLSLLSSCSSHLWVC